MCPPKKQGTSYDDRSAFNTAALTAGLDIGTTVSEFFGNRDKLSRERQLIIDEHNDDIFKWQTKWDNDWIAFWSENQDQEAANDAAWVKANQLIAKNQVQTWNAIADTTNDSYISFAKMMSVGSAGKTGSAGRRAGNTDWRKAVLEHGMKMGKLSAQLSGKLAENQLSSEMLATEVQSKNHASRVEKAAGRPIPGTRPILRDSDLPEQDSFVNLALGIGSNLMDANQTFRSLKSKPAMA